MQFILTKKSGVVVRNIVVHAVTGNEHFEVPKEGLVGKVALLFMYVAFLFVLLLKSW